MWLAHHSSSDWSVVVAGACRPQAMTPHCITHWLIGLSVGKDGSKATTVVATPGHGPDRPQEVSYSDTKVIGNGSFGVVYQAKLCDSGELVAIKKVLQDKRFKVSHQQLSTLQLLQWRQLVTSVCGTVTSASDISVCATVTSASDVCVWYSDVSWWRLCVVQWRQLVTSVCGTVTSASDVSVCGTDMSASDVSVCYSDVS